MNAFHSGSLSWISFIRLPGRHVSVINLKENDYRLDASPVSLIDSENKKKAFTLNLSTRIILFLINFSASLVRGDACVG